MISTVTYHETQNVDKLDWIGDFVVKSIKICFSAPQTRFIQFKSIIID
jgi:hypothetical protein